MSNELDRRNFLKILGASGAATAFGLTPTPNENIYPYLIPEIDIIPGIPNWYASTCRECPSGCGILAKVREGRTIKLEGNPKSPVNRGALCPRGQAALQGLYNPDRYRGPMIRDESGKLQPTDWDTAIGVLAKRIREVIQVWRGKDVVFVTSHLTGTLDRLIDSWLKALGSSRRYRYEALSYESLLEANRISFNKRAIPHYDFASADYILSFGADFLETWLSPVENARGFGASRRIMGRWKGKLVQIEPRLSLTAGNADEWLCVKPGTELDLVLGIIDLVKRKRAARALPIEGHSPERVAELTGVSAETIRRIAGELLLARSPLVVGGGAAVRSRQATELLVAINILNSFVGAVNRTVRFGPNLNVDRLSTFNDMHLLTQEMAGGKVPILFVYGANPLFSMPKACGVDEALKKVGFIVSFSSMPDETSERASLVLPDHTPLESWGDAEPRRGVTSFLQPSMNPVFDTRPVGDTLIAAAEALGPEMTARLGAESFGKALEKLMRDLHRRVGGGRTLEQFTRDAYQSGVIEEPVPDERVSISQRAMKAVFDRPEFDKADGEHPFHLVVFPTLRLHDGSGANKPWLQELPDTMSQVVWDSWIEVHPSVAGRIKLSKGDVVEVASERGKVELPVLVTEGIREDCVAVPFGQGHTAYGRYASGVGANPMNLLDSAPEAVSGALPWLQARVSLRKTGRSVYLATTDGAKTQLGRGVSQVVSLEALLAGKVGDAHGEGHGGGQAISIYEPHPHPTYHWGMTIDLNACIGCGACSVACYAENNISIVGKKIVGQGREMSWIRIERYYDKEAGSDVQFLPMLCQQCDNAPCEPVCPVYATHHNSEGLNAQVYNRCVGTRYCGNNCSYKVRRFNYFQYPFPDPLPMQLNPDVGFRDKGVMEKCSFCIQRINRAKDLAKDKGRTVVDGEIVPACAQTCPTGAIVFGDMKDTDSRVSVTGRDKRAYRVLEVLNTQPSVRYLQRVVDRLPDSEHS